MSITVEIGSSVQALLKKRADAAGITLEAYASRILEHEANPYSERLHPRIQRANELLKPYRGTIGPIPEGSLDPNLLYGEK